MSRRIWVSWTQLKMLTLECRAKWNYSYRDKKPKAIADARGYFPGVVMDDLFSEAIEEDLIECDLEQDVALLQDKLDSTWDKVVRRMREDRSTIQWKEADGADGVSLLERLRKLIPSTYTNLAPFLAYGLEAQWSFKVNFQEDFLLVGRLDFMFEDDEGELGIIDMKVTEHGTKYLDPLQLLMYGLARTIHLKRPVRRFGWLLPYQKEMVWPKITNADKETLMRLFDQFKRRRSGPFPEEPKFHKCRLCDFAATVCDSGRAELEKAGIL